MQDLILLHGAIGSPDTFTELSKSLKEDYKLHFINFPGHGTDPFIEEEYSIKNFGNWVLQYMDDHQISSAHIFGYSLGGYVALNLAKLCPDRILKVCTFATIFNWTPETAAVQSKMLNPEKIKAKVPVFAEQQLKLHGEKWEQVLAKTASMLINLGNDPTLNEEILKDITQPIMITVGDRDQMVTLEESMQTYRYLSNASLVVFPSTVHAFEKLDLELLTYQLKSFLL